MNLTIDIGNSYIKIDLFQDQVVIKHWTVEVIENVFLTNLFNTYTINKCIVCSVRSYDATLYNLLSEQCSCVIELTHQTPLPIHLGYETPETLGKDRIAALMGAWSKCPNSNSLTIDMGTCITYDFLTQDGTFIGGNISAGWQMRLKAMHSFTHCLPEVKGIVPNDFLGTTTETAMQRGAYFSVLEEINGVINKLKLKHSELELFLTGGDAPYFEKQINYCIFAIHNLVSVGLNQILIYNDSIQTKDL